MVYKNLPRNCVVFLLLCKLTRPAIMGVPWPTVLIDEVKGKPSTKTNSTDPVQRVPLILLLCYFAALLWLRNSYTLYIGLHKGKEIQTTENAFHECWSDSMGWGCMHDIQIEIIQYNDGFTLKNPTISKILGQTVWRTLRHTGCLFFCT